MKRATGIHIDGDMLRLACMERTSAKNRLCALFECRLTSPILPRWPVQPRVRRSLREGLQQGFAQVQGAPGAVVLSLGGGFFHLQKTPLELASSEERQEHVIWEAAQTLIDPANRYVVDYVAAGRTAFWIAIRKEVFEFCSELLSPLRVRQYRLEAEPLGLFYACLLAQNEAGSRVAAIMAGHPWLYFVAAESGNLVSAEAVCLESPNMVNGLPVEHSSQNPIAEKTTATLRRWLDRRRHSNQGRSDFRRVLLCGEDHQIATLAQHVEMFQGRELETLAPFSNCTTETLPDSQRRFLVSQSTFSVAGGLAYKGLAKEQI
jgi:hypothetical protein